MKEKEEEFILDERESFSKTNSAAKVSSERKAIDARDHS